MDAVNYQDLQAFIQKEIYGAYAEYGRDIPAEELAHWLTTNLRGEFGIRHYEALDPFPYVYWYDKRRNKRRVDHEDDFEPREGYEQDETAYGGL